MTAEAGRAVADVLAPLRPAGGAVLTRRQRHAVVCDVRALVAAVARWACARVAIAMFCAVALILARVALARSCYTDNTYTLTQSFGQIPFTYLFIVSRVRELFFGK